ncbi:SDR family oxidoreductase [Bdellovibrio sp. 22V]|uniref:SDR family oxidoreductase n=1 Tax=Bdellovibrio TaxID=958 RepID=UPI002542B47A|nr:SDR family oxidoreductase [Bdellovibrio sp. 22V]WII70841.1 SDR family oxidoreductase [Bdellovibrio sp. 22V]
MGHRIMVMGSSGILGREVIESLRNAGRNFIATSRSLERLPSGVRSLQLNYDNFSLLEQAFRDIDILFFLQPLAPNMIPEAEKILRAAKSSGVQFVLKVSELGASPTSQYLFQRVHGAVDDMLAESGLRYCIFRPNTFMQNFIFSHGEPLRQGALFLPEGEGRTSFVDARDVAEAALRVFDDPSPYHKLTFDLTGERAISNAEAVALISNQVARRLAYVPVTEEVARRFLENTMEDRWQMDAIMSLHRATREGMASQVTDAFERLTGKHPRRFEDFCFEMKDEWKLRPPPDISL